WFGLRAFESLRRGGADVRKVLADEDRAARTVLPGIPGAVLRDDAVVGCGRSDRGNAGTGRRTDRCGVAREHPDRARERLVVLQPQVRGVHALVAVVGVAD